MGRARLHDTVKDLGWGNGLAYLLMRALHRLSAGRARLVKYDLVVQPLLHDQPVCRGRGRNLHVRELSPGEAQLVGGVRDPAIITAREQQGARCLGVLRDEHLLGVLWYATAPYQEDEVRCLFVPTPADRAVWDFDVYVIPEERLGLAFGKIWEEACQRLAAQGYRYTCSRISAFNPASRTAHERLGARIVGKATFLCVGPWQAMVSTLRPFVHISLRPVSRPRIEVGPPKDL